MQRASSSSHASSSTESYLAITFGQVLRTLREFARPLSPRSAYTILPDEDMEIGGWNDFNYCWHAGSGRDGGGWREARGSRGEAPAGGFGGGASRLSRNELTIFHEQILSRNEA